MADQDQSQKINDFSGITGVDEDRAKFYLQSANWDVNTALETFYDSTSDDQALSHYAENPTSEEEDIVLDPEPSSVDTAAAPSLSVPSSGYKSKKGSSNIFSLSSFGDGDESENSDTEEGQQAYYAGGSEHSGQQILGPDKSKKRNPTGNLFDAAKKHGAAVVAESSEEGSKKKAYFRGAGYTLGSDVEPSQQVSSSLSKEELKGSKPQTVVIKFWSNGFSVDTGPLRDFNDPTNKNFLDSIAKGEVPTELRNHARNSEVHVNMEDHREEEYVKPKESLQAFSGAGHMLGSPMPTVISDTSSPPPASSTDCQTSVFQVDESKPTTSIQIRLADGTRLVTKFNHDSTIGDIRNVVRNARPNTGNFNLMTTFPNKVLTEDNVTISDAKLLNAVIVQRMT